MINRVCSLCNEYVNDTWTLRIYDDRESVEVSGHQKCIDGLENEMNQIKDVHKMPVKKVLKKLGIN